MAPSNGLQKSNRWLQLLSLWHIKVLAAMQEPQTHVWVCIRGSSTSTLSATLAQNATCLQQATSWQSATSAQNATAVQNATSAWNTTSAWNAIFMQAAISAWIATSVRKSTSTQCHHHPQCHLCLSLHIRVDHYLDPDRNLPQLVPKRELNSESKAVPPGYLYTDTTDSNAQLFTADGYVMDCNHDKNFNPDVLTDGRTSTGHHNISRMVIQPTSIPHMVAANGANLTVKTSINWM